MPRAPSTACCHLKLGTGCSAGRWEGFWACSMARAGSASGVLPCCWWGPCWGHSIRITGGHRCSIRRGPTQGSVPFSVEIPAVGTVRGGERRERGALLLPRPWGLHTARAKPSPGQQKTHSRSTEQDWLPGLGIEGHHHKLPAQAAKHIFAFTSGKLPAPSLPLLSDKPSTGGTAFQADIPLARAPIQQIPNAPAAYQRSTSISTHSAGPAVVRHHRLHQPPELHQPKLPEGNPPPHSSCLLFKGSPPTTAIKGLGWAHLPAHTWVLLDQRIRFSAFSHLRFAQQREKGKMGCMVTVPHRTHFHPHGDGRPR